MLLFEIWSLGRKPFERISSQSKVQHARMYLVYYYRGVQIGCLLEMGRGSKVVVTKANNWQLPLTIALETNLQTWSYRAKMQSRLDFVPQLF